MNIESRLQKLEKIQAQKPPCDLFGQFYDELIEKDKTRYLRYIYGDGYKNLEYAEMVEQQARNTLHFVCSSKEFEIDFDDTFLAALARSLELNI